MSKGGEERGVPSTKDRVSREGVFAIIGPPYRTSSLTIPVPETLTNRKGKRFMVDMLTVTRSPNCTNTERILTVLHDRPSLQTVSVSFTTIFHFAGGQCKRDPGSLSCNHIIKSLCKFVGTPDRTPGYALASSQILFNGEIKVHWYSIYLKTFSTIKNVFNPCRTYSCR